MPSYQAYTGLTAASGPAFICAGPDGNLWASEYSAHKILKMSPAGAVLAEYAAVVGGTPYGIVAGPDGLIWVTNYTGNSVSKITTGGVRTDYALGVAAPLNICVGPDGNLWISCNTGPTIAKVTTGGVVTLYTTGVTGEPRGICSDGTDVWFCNSGANGLNKITTGGVVTTYGMGIGTAPRDVCLGPDNNLWVTCPGDKTIKKVRRSDGVILGSFAVTNGAGSLNPCAIISANGELWATLFDTFKIAQCTTGGVVTEHSGPAASSGPLGMCLGPDGRVWSTEFNNNRIGAMTLDAVGKPSDPGGLSRRNAVRRAAVR